MHPTFDIEGKPFVLMTHETAGLRKKFLQRRVGSLADHRDEIMRALDLLFTGF